MAKVGGLNPFWPVVQVPVVFFSYRFIGCRFNCSADPHLFLPVEMGPFESSFIPPLFPEEKHQHKKLRGLFFSPPLC